MSVFSEQSSNKKEELYYGYIPPPLKPTASEDHESMYHPVALEKLSKPPIAKDRVVDTVVIARNRFPGQQVNLDALVKKLKVNTLVDREFHGALKDAKILTDVYLELQGINQMGLQLNERKAEDLNLSGELNLTQIVLTKDETEAHKEFIKNNIPNSNWAKVDKSYE